MKHIAIALGSNAADAPARVRDAFERLRGVIQGAVLSPLYASAPMYYADQPRFVNAVMVGECDMEPFELLLYLKNMEAEMGRVATFRNGPRVIDLDIVLYGDDVMDTEYLTIPHPRMAERPFVMVPLADIVPDWVHLVTGLTIQDMADALVYDEDDLHELA